MACSPFFLPRRSVFDRAADQVIEGTQRGLGALANSDDDLLVRHSCDVTSGEEPNPGKIDRIFAKAVERRTRGRAGLYMQSRFPCGGWENGKTCAPYSVFQGFGDLFESLTANGDNIFAVKTTVWTSR